MRSASLITLRIGVSPAASRNTPTPTSILSGRGSALAMAISASSESLVTGGRSASHLALAWVSLSLANRLATKCRAQKSGVVVHGDALADRYRLAGQHVAGRDLFVGEAVARRHLDLAAGHLG